MSFKIKKNITLKDRKKGVDVNCVHSFFQYIYNPFSNLDYKYTIHYTVGKQTTVDQN